MLLRRLGVLIVLLGGMAVMALGQTYINPPFEGKSTSMVDIQKIEITKEFTIVHMSCTTPDEEIFSGWTACIMRTTYLYDVKRKVRHRLVKARGIPYCPDQYYFTGPGQKIVFKLYFPPIRYDVRHIHIIEDVQDLQNPFNFFNVYLQPLAH